MPFLSQYIMIHRLRMNEYPLYVHEILSFTVNLYCKLSKTLNSSLESEKSMIIFLSISLNMCFGCSKELSHREGSFEYPHICFV